MPSSKKKYDDETIDVGQSDDDDYLNCWWDYDEEGNPFIFNDEYSLLYDSNKRKWLETTIDDICEIWRYIKEMVDIKGLPILENAKLNDFVKFIADYSYKQPWSIC